MQALLGPMSTEEQFHKARLRKHWGQRLAVAVLGIAGIAAASGQVGNYTRSHDNARTGANLNETILTPANVNSASFGKLFTVHTDGQIYAQPLYVPNLAIAGGVHNVVYVASMLNTIYALDADTGVLLWTQNFGTPINPSEVETDQNISWNTGVGILSTPVIDPITKFMYFVTHNEVKVNGVNVYQNRLNVVDIVSGQPVLGSPVNIAATYKTADLINPIVFDAKKHNQRPSLVLANGNIYIAWASHEDQKPYHGWVIAYSASTLAQTAVYSDTTTGTQGGIWQAGSGITADQSGNLYMSTGNGSFGKTLNGLAQTGNSFIKLSPSLELLDYFTPYNSSALNGSDQDLGSSGLLLLPGTNYVLGGGKQGVFYLADTHGMGEFNASEDQVRQEFRAVYGKNTSHIHGTPTYFNSAVNGPTIYVWGENDYLRAYQFNPSTSLLNPTSVLKSSMTAPATNNYGAMPGGFTSISANGTSNGIVWASTPWNGNAVQTPTAGVLYAFNANTLQLLWSDKLQDDRDEVGRFAKYVPPVVANGKVYIPNWGALSNTDGSGNLVVYGLLPQLTVTPSNITVNSGAPIPTLTGTVSGLAHGDTVGTTITVAYSTTATATSAAGTYPITATVTGSSAINYRVVLAVGTLTINGAVPPTGSDSGAISYGNGFTAGSVTLSGAAQLSGNKLRLTDGGLNEAAAAFYPLPQNVQSFTNDFTFQLTKATADGFAMVIQNSSPTAIGVSGGALGYSPSIAKSVAVKFDMYSNSGEGTNSTGLYVNGAAPMVPALKLPTASISLTNGHIFHVHAAYDGSLLNVSITDNSTGSVSTQSYPIDIPGTVGSSTAYVGFTAGTGTLSAVQDILSWVYAPEPSYAKGFSAGGLTFNGGSGLSGTKLRLVDGGTYEARSAFFTTPVNVQKFNAAFTFQITNPTADGFAVVLQGTSQKAVGGYGGSLGFGPILPTNKPSFGNSVAVKFDLFQNTTEGRNSTGLYVNGVSPTAPAVDLTGTGIDLHSGDVFNVTLGYDGTTLVVTIKDTVTQATATQTYKVDIPGIVGSPSGYVGFTAGTGLSTSTIDIQSWTYLAGATIKPTLVYPTISLPFTSSGPAFRVFQWEGFSDGNGTTLDGVNTGDNVTLTVNVPASGIYDVSFNYKPYSSRGIYQLTVDGLAVGAPFDEYSPANNISLKTFDLKNVNLNAGKHFFTFTNVGRNAASTSGSVAFGQIILTAQ